jgi:hypothetical protein
MARKAKRAAAKRPADDPAAAAEMARRLDALYAELPSSTLQRQVLEVLRQGVDGPAPGSVSASAGRTAWTYPPSQRCAASIAICAWR